MSESTERILFVGLGAMGTPMVRRLATAGYSLDLADIDREHAQQLAHEVGAATTDDLATSAPNADAAILMLPDSSAVRGVLGDATGLLRALSRGSVVIDMSSSQPTGSVELAEQARGRGIEFVDAPVSGGVARAETGDLSIMIGGEESTVERCRALLAAMGSSITHTGPVGSAHAMKSLNNLLSAIGLVAASEVLSVGTRFGLEPEVMLRVLNNSTGRNHATEVKFDKHILSRAFDSGFTLRLMLKDLRTALDLAHDTQVTTPLAAACLATCVGAQSMLADDKADHTELARYVERNAGVELSRYDNEGPTRLNG